MVMGDGDGDDTRLGLMEVLMEVKRRIEGGG